MLTRTAILDTLDSLEIKHHMGSWGIIQSLTADGDVLWGIAHRFGRWRITTAAGVATHFDSLDELRAIVLGEDLPKVDLPEGYHLYQGKDAARPDLHVSTDWYFEPDDYAGGEVFSAGYALRSEAADAAHDWVAQ